MSYRYIAGKTDDVVIIGAHSSARGPRPALSCGLRRTRDKNNDENRERLFGLSTLPRTL